MAERGLDFEFRYPVRFFTRAPSPKFAKKWLSYLDGLLLSPIWLAMRHLFGGRDCVYVLLDQSLSPWRKLLPSRTPLVVHTHDLTALKSAMGLLPGVSTSFTGRCYQRYIKSSLPKEAFYICISDQTLKDLVEFGGVSPERCVVVWNSLNYSYTRIEPAVASSELAGLIPCDLSVGFFVHVSNGQWYKNREGLVAAYSSYRRKALGNPLALLIVGPKLPGEDAPGIFHLQTVSNRELACIYSLAQVCFMPSHAEGFCWPLIEAQACGCAVVTTNFGAMKEVAGDHSLFVPLVSSKANLNEWADYASDVLMSIASESPSEMVTRQRACLNWSKNFTPEGMIENYLKFYRIIDSER